LADNVGQTLTLIKRYTFDLHSKHNLYTIINFLFRMLDFEESMKCFFCDTMWYNVTFFSLKYVCFQHVGV